jgi:hypothetical protein
MRDRIFGEYRAWLTQFPKEHLALRACLDEALAIAHVSPWGSLFLLRKALEYVVTGAHHCCCPKEAKNRGLTMEGKIDDLVRGGHLERNLRMPAYFVLKWGDEGVHSYYSAALERVQTSLEELRGVLEWFLGRPWPDLPADLRSNLRPENYQPPVPSLPGFVSPLHSLAEAVLRSRLLVREYGAFLEADRATLLRHHLASAMRVLEGGREAEAQTHGLALFQLLMDRHSLASTLFLAERSIARLDPEGGVAVRAEAALLRQDCYLGHPVRDARRAALRDKIAGLLARYEPYLENLPVIIPLFYLSDSASPGSEPWPITFKQRDDVPTEEVIQFNWRLAKEYTRPESTEPERAPNAPIGEGHSAGSAMVIGKDRHETLEESLRETWWRALFRALAEEKVILNPQSFVRLQKLADPQRDFRLLQGMVAAVAVTNLSSAHLDQLVEAYRLMAEEESRRERELNALRAVLRYVLEDPRRGRVPEDDEPPRPDSREWPAAEEAKCPPPPRGKGRGRPRAGRTKRHDLYWLPWWSRILVVTFRNALVKGVRVLIFPPPQCPYHAVIGYHFSGEWGCATALALQMALRERGLRAYVDVRDAGPGRLELQVLEAIKNSPYLILLLYPGSLDECHCTEHWLRRQIVQAQTYTRTIIPVLKSDFDFQTSQPLPAEIAGVARMRYIRYEPTLFDGVINKLCEFLRS